MIVGFGRRRRGSLVIAICALVTTLCVPDCESIDDDIFVETYKMSEMWMRYDEEGDRTSVPKALFANFLRGVNEFRIKHAKESRKRTPQSNKMVVVGAGPVGLTSALVGIREGYDVRIVEARLSLDRYNVLSFSDETEMAASKSSAQVLQRLNILELGSYVDFHRNAWSPDEADPSTLLFGGRLFRVSDMADVQINTLQKIMCMAITYVSMSEEQFQQGFHRDGEKFQQLLRRTLIAPFKVIDLVVPVEEEEDYFLLGASGKLPKDLKYGSLHAPSIYDVKKYLTKKSSSNRDDEWVFRSSFRVIDFAQLDKRKWQKADVVLLFNPYVVVDASGPYEAVKAGCNVWPEGKGMLMTTFSENLMSNAASRVENERGNSRESELISEELAISFYTEPVPGGLRPLRTKKYKTFTSVSNRAKVVTANVERVPLVTSIPPAEYFEQAFTRQRPKDASLFKALKEYDKTNEKCSVFAHTELGDKSRRAKSGVTFEHRSTDLIDRWLQMDTTGGDSEEEEVAAMQRDALDVGWCPPPFPMTLNEANYKEEISVKGHQVDFLQKICDTVRKYVDLSDISMLPSKIDDTNAVAIWRALGFMGGLSKNTGSVCHYAVRFAFGTPMHTIADLSKRREDVKDALIELLGNMLNFFAADDIFSSREIEKRLSEKILLQDLLSDVDKTIGADFRNHQKLNLENVARVDEAFEGCNFKLFDASCGNTRLIKQSDVSTWETCKKTWRVSGDRVDDSYSGSLPKSAVFDFGLRKELIRSVDFAERSDRSTYDRATLIKKTKISPQFVRTGFGIGHSGISLLCKIRLREDDGGGDGCRLWVSVEGDAEFRGYYRTASGAWLGILRADECLGGFLRGSGTGKLGKAKAKNECSVKNTASKLCYSLMTLHLNNMNTPQEYVEQYNSRMMDTLNKRVGRVENRPSRDFLECCVDFQMTGIVKREGTCEKYFYKESEGKANLRILDILKRAQLETLDVHDISWATDTRLDMPFFSFFAQRYIPAWTDVYEDRMPENLKRVVDEIPAHRHGTFVSGLGLMHQEKNKGRLQLQKGQRAVVFSEQGGLPSILTRRRNLREDT